MMCLGGNDITLRNFTSQGRFATCVAESRISGYESLMNNTNNWHGFWFRSYNWRSGRMSKYWGSVFTHPNLYDNAKKAAFSGIDTVDKAIDEHGGVVGQVLMGGLRKAF